MIDIQTATLHELITQLTQPFDETAGYQHEIINTAGETLAGFARRHTVTHRPLLELLEAAAVPAGSGETSFDGMFESEPAADIDAVEVLDRIRRDLVSVLGIRVLDRRALNLAQVLPTLATAELDDDQARTVTRAARGWVRDARIAVGLDPGPRTMRDRCPYCPPQQAPMLQITGDLQRVYCQRCGEHWTPDHYQFLRRLLNENRTQTTLAAPERTPR